jgi:hypothetical protein
MDTSHGELESSTVGARLALSLDLASLATTRHDFVFYVDEKDEKNERGYNDASYPSL